MATEKRGIMTYVSDKVEEKLLNYCEEKKITRKTKDGKIVPALGTAVSQILDIFFDKSVGTDSQVLTVETVKTLIKEEVKKQMATAGKE